MILPLNNIQTPVPVVWGVADSPACPWGDNPAWLVQAWVQHTPRGGPFTWALVFARDRYFTVLLGNLKVRTPNEQDDPR